MVADEIQREAGKQVVRILLPPSVVVAGELEPVLVHPENVG